MEDIFCDGLYFTILHVRIDGEKGNYGERGR